MRMRKKKHADERLSACSKYLIKAPVSPFSAPSEVFGRENAPVWLEIGAGKGGFACEMARRNPEACYFAMERVGDCVVLCAERAMNTEMPADNLRFMIENADNLAFIFGKGTVDRIFLNFSDPWSKKGYAKRRLTHRRYLALYFYLLKDGGRLTFKTDNDGLFDFSLEEIEALGITLDKMTRDLHSSEWCEGNVMTEYETAFSSMGVKINMLEFTKPSGFSLPLPEEFSLDRKTYGEAENVGEGQ